MGKKVSFLSVFLLTFLLSSCFPAANKGSFGGAVDGVTLGTGNTGGTTGDQEQATANRPSSYIPYEANDLLEALTAIENLDLNTLANQIKHSDISSKFNITASAFAKEDVQASFEIFLQEDGLSDILTALNASNGVESVVRLRTFYYAQGKLYRYRVILAPGVNPARYIETLVDVGGASQSIDSGVAVQASYRLTDDGLAKLNTSGGGTTNPPGDGGGGTPAVSKVLVYKYYHVQKDSKGKVTNVYNIFSTNALRAYTPSDGERKTEAFYTYSSGTAAEGVVPVYQYRRNTSPAAFRYSTAASISGWAKTSTAPAFYAASGPIANSMPVYELSHETRSGFFTYIPNPIYPNQNYQPLLDAVGKGSWKTPRIVFWIPK